MRALFYTLVARLAGFVRPAAGDAEFDEELESCLAMAVEEKVRSGMSPDEARRQARLELGGVNQLREDARAARGLPWLDAFLLDGKLGLRLLRRSWGLTLVGGLAIALTIGLGASIFTIWVTFAGTRLPLDEGDRVVAIQSFDRAAQQVHLTPLADVRRWHEALRSVEDLGAMRPLDAEIVTAEGVFGPVRAAEMTASGFRLARVQPMLGRVLLDQDERAGAERVAVIGYDLWRSAFSGDPAVVGHRLQVAGTPYTVVGVMPERFRFPVNQRLWIPLRDDAVGDGRPEGEAFVFGRLVSGFTPASAQTEVATLGLLPGTTPSRTSKRLEPRVVPYAAGFSSDVFSNSWVTALAFLVGALLLIPPCANIAILVYARTVTRRDEFTVRTALGASRGRIVMQLFVELLVLATGAGIIGFLIARQFSGRLLGIVVPSMQPQNVPFWMDFAPSFPTILCVAALSVVAAAIAGGVPAFHATGEWRRFGLAGVGNRSGGPRLGTTWVTLLATQVALTLAILPSATEMVWGIFRPAIVGPGLPVEEFLTASFVAEGRDVAFDALRLEAVDRLRGEAGISGATASARVPLEEPFADIEVEGGESAGNQARFNLVDERFFDVFGARLLAGRRFDAADFGRGRTPVIVNRSFVAEILGGGNGLGRRVRYRDTELSRRVAPPIGSHEIIGVVADFPNENDGPMMFHPLATGTATAMVITVRSAAGIAQPADRLRSVVTRFEPQLRIGRLRSLDEVYWQRRSPEQTFGAVLGSVVVIVILFSIAGLYTLMTFIVAQRWREIGLRLALGAQPRRLVGGIFGRALVPLTMGAVVGGAAALRLHSWLPITEAGGQSIPGIVPLSAGLVVVIGLLAVALPARRAIRVDPTEALRVG